MVCFPAVVSLFLLPLFLLPQSMLHLLPLVQLLGLSRHALPPAHDAATVPRWARGEWLLPSHFLVRTTRQTPIAWCWLAATGDVQCAGETETTPCLVVTGEETHHPRTSTEAAWLATVRVGVVRGGLDELVPPVCCIAPRSDTIVSYKRYNTTTRKSAVPSTDLNLAPINCERVRD